MKRLALSCQTVVYLSCFVCNVGVLWPHGCVDQDETSHGGRPLTWPHCVRWETSSPPLKGALPQFSPMSVVTKRLDGSRCHLVGVYASPLAILY